MQLSELFAANVPRYTSYPTAPHFHAGIDQTVYHQWLKDLFPRTPLSLYLHVPFCDTLCWFCGCHTSVVNNYAPVRDYCDLLLTEMDLVARALNGRHPIGHIHWGGGSPSMLRSEDVARVDQALRSCFDVTENAEVAVEIDPRGLREETVAAFARAGLTRASIGVQDCNPEVQRAINRRQSREETMAAVAILRKAGIVSINFDLLYGLPNQTMRSWEETLHFAIEMSPDRLAIFGYAHVPTFKKHQALIPASLLPDIETRLCLAEMATQILGANGYIAVGLDHFAKPSDPLAEAANQGALSRNFQGYTTDTASTLIGLGASAISSLPQGYVQNAASVPIYRKAISEGSLPVVRGVALSHQDRIRRYVIERLMCDMQADLAEACRAFGEKPDLLDDARPALAKLAAQGIVSWKGSILSVPSNWRPAVRLVCAAFDAYLPAGTARHSSSI